MADSHRLFFALWPDDALRDAIAEVSRHALSSIARGRRVRSERLHMTLQFLGDFRSPSGVVERATIAAGSIEPPPVFDLTLDRLGSFGRGRVAWLGIAMTPMALAQLHRQLGGALEAQELQPKRADAFVPHVTLARDVGAPVEGAVPALQWTAREFVLVDSIAGEYRIRGRWPLPPGTVSRECRNPESR